jgi:hypothetical protein
MKYFKSILFSISLLDMGLAYSTTSYTGSSFNEIMNVLEDRNFLPNTDIEKKEFSIYQKGLLPQYPVNATSLFNSGSTKLERDSQRTVSERFDYYDRLPKMLHPNGVCVSGVWKIDTETSYSGYFSKGSTGLFIGRISVALQETTSDENRGFGIAGKIFPTMDKNKTVETGNFFTVDVLLGEDTPHVLNTFTTNEPDTGFSFSLLGLFFKIAEALKTADENPGFRPLTQIARLNNSGVVKQPHWLRLSTGSDIIRNDASDFRDEVKQAFLDNKIITYNIEVSDSTKERTGVEGWNKIGVMELDREIISYGCDRRLHFAHPKLK